MTAKKTMRLLLVIDHLSSGGAQGQMTMLACELSARGHQVEFFTYHHESFHVDRLKQAGIKIHHHPKKSRYSLNVLKRLRQTIRNGHFNVVLSFLTTPNIYSVLARGLGKRPRVVISERSSAENPQSKKATPLRKWLINRCYQNADHRCVNSYHLRDALMTRYAWSEEQITTIWNGVDTDKFFAGDLPDASELKLLAIGRVAAYKNAQCLIRAMSILRQQGLPFRVSWLARRFPHLTPEEETHKRELDALIANLGLVRHWQWLPESKHVVEKLHQHHALVHPSIVEGLPNVVCESLSCGRPVFISNVLDHPRLISEGQNGFLFDPNSPTQLAEKISLFAKFGDLRRQQMSRAARDFAEQQLAKSILVDRYEQLLLSLCEPS